MKIGVFIPYCIQLNEYLGAVVKQFSQWDEIVIMNYDFKKERQEDCRNKGIAKLEHCDYVFTVDADELILEEGQRKIIERATKEKADVVFCPVIHYTQDLNYKYKMAEHMPVILLNPKKVKFYETRCVRFNEPIYCKDIFVHHLGFTHSKETMKWKNKNYWNIGNLKEVEQIMDREKEFCQFPEELRNAI